MSVNRPIKEEGEKVILIICLPFLETYSIRIKKNVIKLLKENYHDISYKAFLDHLVGCHHYIKSFN